MGSVTYAKRGQFIFASCVVGTCNILSMWECYISFRMFLGLQHLCVTTDSGFFTRVYDINIVDLDGHPQEES